MARAPKSQAGVKQAVPFLAVSDIEVSVRYYVKGLGFKMTRQWVEDGDLRWCWLQLGGAALMLQEFPVEGREALPSSRRLGEGVTLCFICEDALAFYREIRGRKVEASTPFVGNGMWLTSLIDPDGYQLEFESETDTPEDTQFSESLA